MLVWINTDDAQGLDFTLFERFLGVLNAMLADLRNMDQAFDVAFQAGKGAKFGQAGNDTFDQLADTEFRHARAPRILLQGTHGKADAPLLAVNVDHLDFDFLS